MIYELHPHTTQQYHDRKRTEILGISSPVFHKTTSSKLPPFKYGNILSVVFSEDPLRHQSRSSNYTIVSQAVLLFCIEYSKRVGHHDFLSILLLTSTSKTYITLFTISEYFLFRSQDLIPIFLLWKV